MTLNEMEIIERTAQAKCGRRFIVTLDPLRPVAGEKSILLRVQDREDTDAVMPIVLAGDSTLGEVCEIATVLTAELTELDD